MQGEEEEDAQRQAVWQPYEASSMESFLLRLPRPFYRMRWAAMRYNPLCWPIWNGCTGGEALATTVIVAQMVATGLWWAFDPEFRVNVAVTGALAQHAA